MATKPPVLTDSSFDEASQVPAGAVGLDRTEGILGAGAIPGGSLDRALQVHHQQRVAHAQMYRTNAATAIGKLAKGTIIDPQSGQERLLTPDEIQTLTAQKDEALQQYGKIIGVSKESKGALDKAHSIIDFILGRKQQQGQPDQSGQAGQAQPQGRPGGMTQPPTPQYGSTVGDNGVTLTPPPSAQPAPTAAPSALEQSVAAPFAQSDIQFEKGLGRGLESKKRDYQQGIELRTDQVKRMGMDPSSPTAMRYIATGTFPPVARLQKMLYRDPKTGEVSEGSFDPIQGQILDQQGQVVENAEPATSGMITPKPFKYMSPDGKSELPGFQVGQQYLDMEGKPLPPGTTLYARGLVPTETLRQQITYDPQGNPHLNTLETIHKPITSPTGGTGGAGPAPKTGGGGGAASAAPSAGTGNAKRKGGATAPPSPTPSGSVGPAGQAPAVDALGKPLGTSSGMWNQARQAIVPVREAATQLFGDPTQPDLKGLADYAHLSEDGESRKRVANALQLTMNGLEAQEKAKGGLTELLGNYGGLPQALVGSQTAVMQDVVGKLSPDEQEAFNAEMAAFGTVVGLRSLTKASAAQFSIKSLEREVPLFGINTFSRPQFYDKMSKLAEEVYNGSRNLPMPQSERDFYQGKVKEYRAAASGRKGGATVPPSATGAGPSSKSVDDQIMELIGGAKKKP